MPLFEPIQIETELVAKLVKEHWGLTLGKLLKSSQNNTYEILNGSFHYIVRATPDPENKRNEHFKFEATLLHYLDDHRVSVCAPIPSNLTKEQMVHEYGITVMLFPWAIGSPVSLSDWEWASQDQTHSIGLWLGKFHLCTQQFVIEKPLAAEKARQWVGLHDNVMMEAPIDPRDQASRSDPTKYGIIHGDVNISNYFWDPSSKIPCVFDWDQLCQGWFMYDLAQLIWGCKMLVGGGKAPIGGAPVPESLTVAKYAQWLIEGYEEATGKKVDKDELQRMVMLRREFYSRFCHKALLEIPKNHPMAGFCSYVVTLLDSGAL